MQPSRRNSPLVAQVRLAMSHRDVRRPGPRDATDGPDANRHALTEQMARWETDGGALGHSAEHRPRPFP